MPNSEPGFAPSSEALRGCLFGADTAQGFLRSSRSSRLRGFDGIAGLASW
jgi:hypothetical protein